MKTASVVFLSLAILFVAATCSKAVEHDARLIDWIGIEMNPSGDVDGISGFLWGEQALSPDVEMWSFLFGGQYGRMNPHFFDGLDFWSVGLGLRCYIFPATTLDTTVHYGKYEDTDGRPSVRWGQLAGKQKFLPESMPVQPYLTGRVGMRYSDDILHFYDGEVFSEGEVSEEFFVGFGGGFEISMLDNMEIVLDLSFTESDDLDDDALASVAMKYFWD
ncbi:MAG: hypothetical protein ISS35_00645 [Kiritimatiellae bacterium]|nr:hypothetical protein [Kiritimatiellia bacterium]